MRSGHPALAPQVGGVTTSMHKYIEFNLNFVMNLLFLATICYTRPGEGGARPEVMLGVRSSTLDPRRTRASNNSEAKSFVCLPQVLQ